MSALKIVETANRRSAFDDPTLSFSLAAPAASAKGWPTCSQDHDRDRSVRGFAHGYETKHAFVGNSGGKAWNGTDPHDHTTPV